METGKFKVNAENKTVTIAHKTKTSDGHVEVTTTFDLSGLNLERLLKRAADAELISWRARSGIKDLTTVEALAKFKDITVDCSKTIERVKHVETEEEKKLKALIKELTGGKQTNIAALTAKLEALKNEAAAQDEMEAGEEV